MIRTASALEKPLALSHASSYYVGMTYCAPATIDAFDSDDLFAHWRAEDARIREDEELDLKRDLAYAAAQSGDLDAVMAAWDEGLLDDVTAARALYGCSCRRCRKSDPGGCVA